MKIFYSNSKRKKMNTENKFQDARTAMKDLAKKVETIDLSGSGLVSGGKKKKTTVKKTTKKQSATRKSSVAKSSKSRSASRKKTTSTKKSSKTRKTSAKRSSPKSKKMPMSLTEHKLADNLIQLGVQLKNMQLDGGKKGRKSPRQTKSYPKL